MHSPRHLWNTNNGVRSVSLADGFYQPLYANDEWHYLRHCELGIAAGNIKIKPTVAALVDIRESSLIGE